MDMLLERERMAYWNKVLGRGSAGSTDLPSEKQAQSQMPTSEGAAGDLITMRLRSIIFEVEALLKAVEENDAVTYEDFDTRLKKVILSVNLLRRGIQERRCLLIRRGIQERRFG
jgi:hypothetical protein